jgi:hypothetical protein
MVINCLSLEGLDARVMAQVGTAKVTLEYPPRLGQREHVPSWHPDVDGLFLEDVSQEELFVISLEMFIRRKRD